MKKNTTKPAINHCKTCGSEIVETINDSNFRDGECGPCEYQRYRSLPDLMKVARYLRIVCDDRLSQLREEREEMGPPPEGEEEYWFDDIDDRIRHYELLRQDAEQALAQTEGTTA